MSLVLTQGSSGWFEVVLLVAFVAIAFSAALVALGVRPPRMLALLTRTMHASSQLPVRLALFLLAAFVVVSEDFGFEAIPSAFAAGMVVGLATRGEEGKPLRQKIEVVAFGFLVPFFFVTSGVKFDLATLWHSGEALALVPVFFGLLLLVRGAPVLLYRNVISLHERLPLHCTRRLRCRS
jgi:Kef-type K+ transport system membrane component KefB